jgi:hypothetical protein
MTGTAPQANTAIVPALTELGAQLPFQLLETRPDSITWHMIWDHELDRLVNISRPITLGVATTLAGAFLGLLPSVAKTLEDASERAPADLGDISLSLVAAACLAGAVVASFFAYRGQVDAFAVRENVRSRNIRPVNPPQQPTA